MATKTFNTRIRNKIDTFANWTKNDPVLLNGEIGIVVVPASTGAVQQEPAILIKIGDGTKKFSELEFISSKAADVYGWAKAATKPTYAASEISGLSDYISGQIQDTDTQYKIEADAGRPATDAEIAKELNIPEEEYTGWKSEIQLSNMLSLDDYLEQSGDSQIEPGGSQRFEQPEKAVEKEELKQMLVEAMKTLTEKECSVITLYYYEDLTLKEISRILEVSESRVSQLHSKALQKMKNKLGDSVELLSLF